MVNQTTPSGEVATGMTEDQAAQELMSKWGIGEDDEKKSSKASSDAQDEEEESEEQADEANDSEEDESEDDADESGEIEIDVAGEKFKLPPAVAEQAKRIEAKAKEVEAGATRKFQEAADLRKAAELTATQATQQAQFNEANAHLLSDLTLVKRRMQLFESMDVSQMAEQDPIQLNKINAEYNQLASAERRIQAELQRVHGLFGQDQEKVKGERFKVAQEYARTHIKDWTAGGSKRAADYVEQRGIARADIEDMLLRDPRLILVLEDAAYGARVRNSKPDQQKRIVDAAKTLKPGAGGQSKSSSVQKGIQARERLGKTGSVEDAARALLYGKKRK